MKSGGYSLRSCSFYNEKPQSTLSPSLYVKFDNLVTGTPNASKNKSTSLGKVLFPTRNIDTRVDVLDSVEKNNSSLDGDKKNMLDTVFDVVEKNIDVIDTSVAENSSTTNNNLEDTIFNKKQNSKHDPSSFQKQDDDYFDIWEDELLNEKEHDESEWIPSFIVDFEMDKENHIIEEDFVVRENVQEGVTNHVNEREQIVNIINEHESDQKSMNHNNVNNDNIDDDQHGNVLKDITIEAIDPKTVDSNSCFKVFYSPFKIPISKTSKFTKKKDGINTINLFGIPKFSNHLNMLSPSTPLKVPDHIHCSRLQSVMSRKLFPPSCSRTKSKHQPREQSTIPENQMNNSIRHEKMSPFQSLLQTPKKIDEIVYQLRPRPTPKPDLFGIDTFGVTVKVQKKKSRRVVS